MLALIPDALIAFLCCLPCSVLPPRQSPSFVFLNKIQTNGAHISCITKAYKALADTRTTEKVNTSDSSAFCFLTSFHSSSVLPNSEAKTILNALGFFCDDDMKWGSLSETSVLAILV